MKNRRYIWFGIAAMLTLLMSACGANSSPEAPTEIAIPEPAVSGPRTRAIAPDFTLPDHNGSPVHLADELQQNQTVVLVFYSGYECPPCMDQLGGLVEDSAKFEAKEARVIAIAHQTQNGAMRSVENTNAQFPILVDKDHAVSDAYGVYLKGILPSVFIIDQDGQILWHDVATSAATSSRVPSQTIIENLPDINE